MRQFLKTNKHHVRSLCNNLDQTVFSEDCGASIIHQIINSLTTILTSATDNKVFKIITKNCMLNQLLKVQNVRVINNGRLIQLTLVNKETRIYILSYMFRFLYTF